MRCGKVFAGMENFDLWSQLAALGQVIAIDLVLAGDNAIVVGMAAAGVPLEQRRKVIFWGVGAAIALRIFFALITTQLLAIIGLTLAGGVLLLWVCWKMFRELRSHGQDEVAPDEALEAGPADAAHTKTLGAAIWQIVVADVSMSLDNVLAVAGAAKDHPTILIIGLASGAEAVDRADPGNDQAPSPPRECQRRRRGTDRG
jgi:YjbE family integral membrane protein